MSPTMPTALLTFALTTVALVVRADNGTGAPPPLHLSAGAQDHYVDLHATIGTSNTSGNSPGAAPLGQAQFLRAPICQWVQIGTGSELPCVGDPVPPLEGCDPAATLPPLWQRARPDADASWGAWELVGPPACATAAEITPAMVLAEFRRLPLEPSRLVVQPDRGWVLVNKPTVVSTDSASQTLTTTILGTLVTITAKPAGYTWDFGDGETLVTTDPGRPWPDADLSHAYARVGAYRITLTTTWSATYTVDTDPTVRQVPGTAATSTAADVTVEERRAHLVAGACAGDESGPGC